MNLSEIEFLVANRALETPTLEFKAAASLERSSKKITELVKDVTGMANAAGGRIIYGIAESGDRHARAANAVDPIENEEIGVDWINQVIASRTSPPFSKYSIGVIVVEAGKRIFVIDVEQGDTAHQSLDDKLYHQRIGTQVLAMQDFQIRDVMNRRNGPRVELRLIFEKGVEENIDHCIPEMKNAGELSVTNWKLCLWAPEFAIAGKQSQFSMMYVNSKVRRRQLGKDGLAWREYIYASDALGSAHMGALHPGDSLTLRDTTYVPPIRIHLSEEIFSKLAPASPHLSWKLFSVDAKPFSGAVPFSEWYRY